MTAADVAAKTMNSLITSDISTSADKALTNPWKGAEAIHFYLLCQRQLYQKYSFYLVIISIGTTREQ
jgi:hypothetical protein